MREKIIVASAREFIVIAGESELVGYLGGEDFAIPVGIEPFGFVFTMKHIFGTCGKPVLRWDEERNGLFLADEGHYIVDIMTEDVIDLEQFEVRVKIPGVIELGIFRGMAHLALLGTARSAFGGRIKKNRAHMPR